MFKFYPEDRAKFHFGDSGGKLKEMFSSDQLFSALYNCIVLMYGSDKEKNALLESIHQSTISSLYHGFQFLNLDNGERKELFFLPRPSAPIDPGEKKEDLLKEKKRKKIKYISMEAFRILRESWNEEGKYFDFELLDLEILGGKYACTAKEIQSLKIDSTFLEKSKFFNVEVRPKVAVSRFNSYSENLYHQKEMEIIYQKAGNYVICPFMYFLYQGDANDQLTAAVRLMADEGLGGRRTQGMGFLGEVVEAECSDELFAGDSSHYMSLSSVFPKHSEVDKITYYELEERSGYIYSGYGRALRKKRLRLLKEGSVFSGKISGQIVDIRPDGFKEHEVYLNGKAFLIPIGGV